MSIVFYPLLKVNDAMETERELNTQEDKSVFVKVLYPLCKITFYLSHAPIQML